MLLPDHFVQVTELEKNYNSLKAVNKLSFHIDRGEVFGLLGPNGAGKTTTIEIMEGLRKASAGSVSIKGFDPRKHAYKLKEIIGVQLQIAKLEDRVRVREALKLFASFLLICQALKLLR